MKDKRFQQRYLVLKNADIHKYLTRDQRETLEDISNVIAQARKDLSSKPPLEGIFIEQDWPEYEAAAQALHARITSELCIDEGCSQHGTEHVCVGKDGLPNGNGLLNVEHAMGALVSGLDKDTCIEMSSTVSGDYQIICWSLGCEVWRVESDNLQHALSNAVAARKQFETE